MGTRYKQLGLEDRCTIARLYAEGCSLRQTAAGVDCTASTVSRELKRNVSHQSGYQPAFAERQTRARRWKGSKLDRSEGLRNDVLKRLACRWSPEQIARRMLGGRELAAMAGAILAARTQRVPVLIDGYVATAAAAVLHTMRPDALDHCLAAHCSAEPAHRNLLKRLGKEPVLDLGMRLGEASGAALAAGLLKAAVNLHNDMATFASAGVSDKGE